MSTNSAPGPTSTQPASPSSTNGAQGQSSSLYLFTFLATLLLLLAVSCAIVIRSFILRRRFRRRIEEAIAAGVLMPGSLDDGLGGGMGRNRRRDFGEKPKLWEVWVDENGQIHDPPSKDSSSDHDHLGKGEGKWEEILPVSATILGSNPSKPGSASGNGNNSSSASLSPPTRTLFSRLFSRRASPSATPSALEEQNPSATELTAYPASVVSKERVEEERLQVSVLISMPNPNGRRSHNRDSVDGSLKGKGRGPEFEDTEGDGEIPDVVFGVAEVGLRP
ncbi:hypothetical protein BU17DRAFT_87378 [Hysterangium stoloniferum]|nr:hypothetical protein BU17DRAFT_87378 [Hysterangium stoloniferum]